MDPLEAQTLPRSPEHEPLTPASPSSPASSSSPAQEAQSLFGAGGAVVLVSDLQTNGNHQLPLAASVKAEQAVEEPKQANGNHQLPPPASVKADQAVEEANGNHELPPVTSVKAEQAVEEGDAGLTMEGVASIALLPSGAISGHFICLPDSICYGLHGTSISCERECSRGEDYRLVKLAIIDFKSKREKVLVVECRGHDAARLQNIDHLHGDITAGKGAKYHMSRASIPRLVAGVRR